jgi:hypothetical protein
MLLTGTIFNFLSVILALLFGILYLTRPSFMKYHRKAINLEWVELGHEMQTLIQALMRATGGGFLAVAFVTVILQIEFIIHHSFWIALSILITGLLASFGSMFAVLLMKFRTDSHPPVFYVMLYIALLLAGFFFNIAA